MLLDFVDNVHFYFIPLPTTFFHSSQSQFIYLLNLPCDKKTKQKSNKKLRLRFMCIWEPTDRLAEVGSKVRSLFPRLICDLEQSFFFWFLERLLPALIK